MIRALMRTTPWLLCAAAIAVTAQAQTARPEDNSAKVIPGQIVVDESTAVVQRMKQDPDLAGMIDHSKAVLVVPRYGADPSRLAARADRNSPGGDSTLAAESMSRHGSPGVFLVHRVGWSGPAFFSVSNLGMGYNTNGGQASESAMSNERGTPVAMIFMTAHAADQVQRANNVSLSGLNVAHYDGQARGSMSNADVVVWTPQPMMQAADLASAQVHYDGAASNAYYMNQATLPQILTSAVSTQRAARLQGALSMRVASSK